ncbi:3-keto-disaccharide hydrolase [Ulvibacterium sp.]|uniref:3-keto-disaccharide hydrolase n=1 Tax=Ulvibacterium sp. TaxID=2665914 RepID=UPI003BAC8579
MNTIMTFLFEKVRKRIPINLGLSRPLKLLVLNMLLGALGCSAQKFDSKSLFDGTTLNGWETVNEENAKYWSVKDSAIVGGDGITNIPVNTYLHTMEKYGDFEFRCLFRITGNHDKGLINSGIQYRSVIEDGKIVGYQADIGKGYWGDIYDEHRRALLNYGDLNTVKHLLDEDGWNSYIIRCQGNLHELYINGVKVNEYLEEDTDIPSKGVIGLQLHKGGNAQVVFKHIVIESL